MNLYKSNIVYLYTTFKKLFYFKNLCVITGVDNPTKSLNPTMSKSDQI